MEQLTSRPELAQIDLHDTVAHLRSVIERSYLDRFSASSEPFDRYLYDPASRWVAHAVIAGRSLPINAATVKALRSVVGSLLEAGDRSRRSSGA